VFDGTVVID